MTDTDKLEPGPYWVRETEAGDWGIAEFSRTGRWRYIGWDWDGEPPAIIGPRLTPPDSDAGRGT